MNVSKLNDQAVTDTIKAIFDNLIKSEIEDQRVILADLVVLMDRLSEDDFFGTEGWEHWVGLDD